MISAAFPHGAVVRKNFSVKKSTHVVKFPLSLVICVWNLSEISLFFTQIFKMWNKELYVREQQDAYEFFTSLIDQMDEYLKVKPSGLSLLVCVCLLGVFSAFFLLCSSAKEAGNHLTYLTLYVVFRSVISLLLSFTAVHPTASNFTSPTENRERPNI